MSKFWIRAALITSISAVAAFGQTLYNPSNSSPLPTGVVNQSYPTVIFTVAGSPTGSFTWQATGLPAGLTLNSGTGVLSGTPTVTFNGTVQIQATSAAGIPLGFVPYQLRVNAQLAISNASPLPAGTVGTSYLVQFGATGGQPNYTFFGIPDPGPLPDGLTLSPDVGQLSGIPTTPGVYTFSVQAFDSADPQQSVTKLFTLSINNGPLTITSPQNLQRGVVNRAYTNTLQATGGLTPYTWARVIGAGTGLPPGLSFASDGTISGTPTSTGTFTFRATVSDAEVPIQSQQSDFTLIINPTLVITTTTLPNGFRNTPYTGGPLASTGGQPPVTWAVATGTLPTGMTLNPNGTFSGTPTALGTFTFGVSATDSGTGIANQVATQTLSITITNPPLTISTNSPLPNAMQGQSYTTTLVATGGTTPYTWSVLTGSLPSGLTLNPNTGVISGTPTTTGVSTFTIEVQDSTAATVPQTAQKTFQLTVDPPLTISTSSPLPQGNVGSSYSQTLAAINGTPPYVNWAFTTGNVPPGLTLNSSTGVISGTPTTQGVFTFGVQVSDSASPTQHTTTKTFTVTIAPPLLSITSTSPLTNGNQNAPYSFTFTATGGSPPYQNWQVSSGALPAGLTLNAGTGVLSGTPTAQGTFNFVVSVQDSSTFAQQTASASFSLTIGPPLLSISTSSPLPSGTAGQNYSQTLTATGGVPPYLNWTVTSGSLPAGLTLNASTGTISGIPTGATIATFTVSVRDSFSEPQIASKSFTLTIATQLSLSISTASPLPNGTVSTPYSLGFAATGGVPPYINWTVSAGSLPAGLTLNSSTGVLTGTPSTAGVSSFTVQVQDSGSPQLTATKAFTLTIDPSGALTITTNSPLPGATINTAYSTNLAATGGTTPYTWTIASGTLPTGVTLSSAGVVAGTPTQSGTFTVTYRVTDNAGSNTTKALDLVVSPGGPVITTTSPLPTAVSGTPYSLQFASTGGLPPYIYSLQSGTLPTGLTLSSAGLLSGTTTQLGTFNFTVLVADAADASSSKNFVLNVNATGPAITTTSPLPNGTEGQSYLLTFAATGGTTPYTWGLFGGSGSLPPGLTLLSNGTLSGTPTQRGTYRFTVALTDNSGTIVTKDFSVTILAGPPFFTTTTLPDANINVSYSNAFSAAGGTSPYTFGLSSGTLPPGMTITSTGFLQGTPTQAGSFPFVARVTDSQGVNGTGSFTLLVIPNPLVITTTSPLPSGTRGFAYSQTFATTGGAPPFVWTRTAGELPAGLTLNATTGVLSGTPTGNGTFVFTVQVADSLAHVASKQFSLTIGTPTVTITTPTPLPLATANSSYSQQFAATGGLPPFTWSLVGGALPAGLTLSSAGLLSGTPTVSGSFTFTVRATDSAESANQGSKTFTLVVDAGFPVITTVSLPPGQALLSYVLQLQAAGGTPPYTWGIANGSLPSGFAMSSSGLIIGTAGDATSATFTARVTDNAGRSGTRSFTLVISGRDTTTPARLEIATASMPDGSVGQVYGLVFAARNGSPPFHWSFTGLPADVGGNANGEVLGTPRRAGTFTVSVSVSDDARGQASATFQFVVRPVPVVIVTEKLGDGRVDAPYTASVAAAGGLPPYTFSVLSGSLPPGVSLAANGVLSGVPTQVGSFSFGIQATDQNGEKGNRSFSITIQPPLLAITTAILPNAVIGSPYGAGLEAVGGVKPYQWSASGLPPGLSINADSGAISGTPTTNGQFQVGAQVGDASGQAASRSFTITVTTNLTITTETVGNMIAGTPVSIPFAAAGGRTPFTWGVTAGSVPTGLSLGSDGVLSGTPSAEGDFTFTVEVTDANGVKATKSFSTRVVLPLAITTDTLGSTPIAAPFSLTLSATGGRAPYTWSLAGGELPPGLTLSSGGDITGTPTTAGSFTFTARAVDSGQPQQTRERSYTLQITLPDVSGLNITLPQNPQPGQQTPITVVIASPYPVDLAGTLVITFQPNAVNNADDPAIQFSTGGRSAEFTIPAGQTQAVFRVANLQLQTGTTAGTITLTTTFTAAGSSINCNCQLARTIVIPRTTPVLNGVRVQRTANGFNVIVTGFSSTREMVQGTFRFAGTNLQASDFTVQLTNQFNAWFQSTQAAQFGGQFSLSIPFTIQGDTTNVNSVTVTLANTVGSSSSVTTTF